MGWLGLLELCFEFTVHSDEVVAVEFRKAAQSVYFLLRSWRDGQSRDGITRTTLDVCW